MAAPTESQMRVGTLDERAHPDLNQGPADLQSVALAMELCTHMLGGDDFIPDYFDRCMLLLVLD